MALKLQVTLPSGVVAEYWRLGRLTADRMKNKMEARLDLYINKATRDAGNQLIQSKTIFADTNPDGVDTNYISAAYDTIKRPVYEVDEDTGEQVQVNPFVNAEDC